MSNAKTANSTDKAVKATRKPGPVVHLSQEAIDAMNKQRPAEANPFTKEAQRNRKWT